VDKAFAEARINKSKFSKRMMAAWFLNVE
jgi:hypothetical protein